MVAADLRATVGTRVALGTVTRRSTATFRGYLRNREMDSAESPTTAYIGN